MSDEMQISHDELAGVDWANDALFFTHSYTEETSQFDDNPTKRYNYGCECYKITVKVRVPIAFKDCDDLIDWFVEKIGTDHPEAKGFWVSP